MDIRKLKAKILDEFYDAHKIMTGTLQEEQERQDYLQGICQRLMGNELDFEQYPVYFCIVDDKQPNAAFIPPKRAKKLEEDTWSTPTEEEIKEAAREQYPTIFVTKGLLEMVENEDQLAYILGHELGHLRQDFLHHHDNRSNSKMEEITSDLNSFEMMTKARYDINEGRKIAARIFSGNKEYDLLQEIISAALDAHPNNESRLNAIDVKIKSIEDNYQKQNVNINDFSVTPIDEKFLSDSKRNRYVSCFEKELTDLGYYQAALPQKQEILISYLKKIHDNAQYRRYKHDGLKPHYYAAIHTIIINHIASLYEQMPRKVIKQSDADYFSGPLTTFERSESYDKWIDIIGKEYCDINASGYVVPLYANRRQEILGSFPFKIVPNEEYEKEFAIEELKRQKQRENISNGTDLSVMFWDKINLMASTPPYLFDAYTRLAIAPLQDIDISKTEIGKLAIAEMESLDSSERVVGQYSNYILYSQYNSSDLKLPENFSIPAVKTIYSKYFYTFDPKKFPKLDLEATPNPTIKKIPHQILNNSSCNTMLGVSSNQETQDVYSVTFNPYYQDIYDRRNEENLWTYFIDKDGNILDSFSYDQLANKTTQLIEHKKQEIYKKLADKVKSDYAKFKALKQNPDTPDITSSDLSRLKRYTGLYETSRKSNKYEDFDAGIDITNPDIQYQKEGLNRIIDNRLSNEEKKKLLEESGLTRDDFERIFFLSDADFKTAIMPYLSKEEQEFVSLSYNPENDKIVFDAICKDMEKSQYSYIWTSQRTEDYRRYTPNNYSVLHKHFYSHYTNEQLVQYYKKFFEITPYDDKNYDCYNASATAITLDMHHLLLHIERQVRDNPNIEYKNLDFSDYQPLFAETVSKNIGIPTDLSNFTLSNYDQMPSHHHTFMEYALTLHILKGETNRINIKDCFNFSSFYTTNFTEVVKEKFEPFLLNRENYPQDTLDAVQTFSKIPSKLHDIEKSGYFIIDIIKQEKDPKTALHATLKFLEIIKHNNSKEMNKLKDELLQDNIIFDKNLPLINRIAAYQQINKFSGFADDYKIQNKLLNGFIEEIETIKDPVERNAHYDIFISKEHRISDPDIRRHFQRLWVESAFEACGRQIDDNSEALHEKIKFYTSKLNASYIKEEFNTRKTIENVNIADRIEIAKMLADRFVSQEKLSLMIKPKPASFDEMEQGSRSEYSNTIAGFDVVKTLIKEDRQEASELINFLLSKGTMPQCQEYYEHINKKVEDRTNTSANISPETLQVLHREFWGYPLEARAVLINDLLYSASSRNNENRWEDIFKNVAPRIFPNADSDMSKIGTEFLHSYIKSRKENERTLYLAAMMVAANENSDTTDPEKSIAKGIRLFLENSGPAAIKLGQAMASYTDVPKFIRDEMQQLKSNASRPSRWEIYEWLDFYKNKDGDSNLQFDKDIWLGRIIGSASYFVTMEKGKFEDGKIPQSNDRVTKILRAGAKISSDKEFKIFENMLYDLAQKGVMKNGIDSFVRLVKQAQETVEVETNLDIGYSQLETAKKLYKEKEISVDGYTFNLHVADWPEYGKNWADLERAQGVDLDEIKDEKYKRALSKAYFTVELMNMLSGSRFDHDRHGKQLKIDPTTNTIGLFDTGAMAIVDPSEKDKELLGKIIYRTLQKTLDYSSDGSGIYSKVGTILSSEIEKAYLNKETDSTYLTECQRGLLALTDFYKDLSANDFLECINGAINNQDMPIDKNIIKGFVSEGIKNVGIFESDHPLLSHKDKETLGVLIFNVYASASNNGTENIGTIIQGEVGKLKEQGVNMPILDIVANKMSEKSSEPLGINIPKEFMPTLSEMVNNQEIDIAILKGIMKEAVHSIDLQGQKDNYSAQDRQELGKLLYDTYNSMNNQNSNNANMADTFIALQQSGEYKTELGAKIATVIKTAQQLGPSKGIQDIDINEIVKTSLLSGNMDKEIAKGISERFKEKHPNLLLRTQIAKSLNSFLSQQTSEMSVVKKAIIKLFVKKPNIIAQTTSNLDKQLASPEINNKIKSMIQGYVSKFTRLINRKQVNTNIKISDNTRS